MMFMCKCNVLIFNEEYVAFLYIVVIYILSVAVKEMKTFSVKYINGLR